MTSDAEDLKSKLEMVSMANDFKAMVNTAGWGRANVWLTELIQNGMDSLREADTSKPETMDELRRWQIAIKIVEGLNSHIQYTIDEAQKISGAFTMSDLSLMEKLKNEQPESRPDPAGY
jgi:hypothetical protein